MSDFHDAFYLTCRVHKDTEYPKWRKCPKCSAIITYTEKEVQDLLVGAVNLHLDYVSAVILRKSYEPMPEKPRLDKWLNNNKKKV